MGQSQSNYPQIAVNIVSATIVLVGYIVGGPLGFAWMAMFGIVARAIAKGDQPRKSFQDGNVKSEIRSSISNRDYLKPDTSVNRQRDSRRSVSTDPQREENVVAGLRGAKGDFRNEDYFNRTRRR